MRARLDQRPGPLGESKLRELPVALLKCQAVPDKMLSREFPDPFTPKATALVPPGRRQWLRCGCGRSAVVWRRPGSSQCAGPH